RAGPEQAQTSLDGIPTASLTRSARGARCGFSRERRCYGLTRRRTPRGRREDRGRSRTLEDRRVAGPARMGRPLGSGGVLRVSVISLVTGIDLTSILGGGPSQVSTSPPTQEELNAEEGQVRVVSFVLDDLQATWSQMVEGQYPEAT